MYLILVLSTQLYIFPSEVSYILNINRSTLKNTECTRI